MAIASEFNDCYLVIWVTVAAVIQIAVTAEPPSLLGEEEEEEEAERSYAIQTAQVCARYIVESRHLNT